MLRLIINSLLGLVLLGVFSIAAILWFLLPGLPSIETLKDMHLQVPLRVYSADNSLIAEFGEKRRIPVQLEDVPDQMIEAFLAAEDDNFYNHPGVDWQSIARAALHVLKTGEKTQGGSTITMQVARNFFLTREKTYLRKLNEILLALKIERELSKDQILGLYLNKIYLGNRAYGVGAAAQVYFGRTLDELTLPQIAMIAGLPKAPSALNPLLNPEGATARRNYVLRRMYSLSLVDDAEYNDAIKAPLTAKQHGRAIQLEAPYVAEMVRVHLTQKHGDHAYTSGYRVFTTIHDRLQRTADEALRNNLINYSERHGYRGPEASGDNALRGSRVLGTLYPAAVTKVDTRTIDVNIKGIGPARIEWSGLSWARPFQTENSRGPAPSTAHDIVKPGDIIRVRRDEDGNWRLTQIPAVAGALVSLSSNNGAVLALSGGFDFNLSKFNRVTQGLRQPGSSFKPFIYSAALEAGFTAASFINDAPLVFDIPGREEPWRPENYSRKHYGPTRLREALIHSRNVVSVRLLQEIGIDRAVEHGARFGFDPAALPPNLSLSLGSGTLTPLALARAYAVLANGGYLITPYFIDRIETEDGILVEQSNPARVCSVCDDGQPSQSADGGPTPQQADAPNDAVRAIPAQNAWIMNSMLQDVIRYGTGRRANVLGRNDIAGKTGTTNEQKDAWFSGFNREVVTTAWVGFDQNHPLGDNETGSRAALPMWIDYMRIALEGVPESILEQPTGIVTVRIDPKTGLLASASHPSAIFESFRQQDVPKRFARRPFFEEDYSGSSSSRAASIPEQLF